MDTISVAHQQSKSFVIDPVYSASSDEGSLRTAAGASNGETSWLYGDAELECYRLAVLRKRANDAELNVYYPGSYHESARQGFFRLKTTTSDQEVSLRSNGRVVVRVEDNIMYDSGKESTACPATLHRVELNNLDEASFIVVQVSTDQDKTPPEPPCLWINGSISEASSCEWSSDGSSEWSSAKTFSSCSPLLPPHLEEQAQVHVIHPERQIGVNLYDFGLELLGHVMFEVEQDNNPVSLQVGETVQEAKNSDRQHMEQSTSLIKSSSSAQMWESAHLVAFRYVNVQATQVSCRAQFHPVQYFGAFAASDELLSKIWMNAAYTLRLCMHEFIVDGIKRDRLPWAGDLAVSLLANAYTFHDAEIVRRTLTALGREGIRECDINGIVDYSLWWIISQDLYQLYYSDMDHLNREWPRIKDAITCLITRSSSDTGFLETHKDKNWVFIDWVDGDKATALQIIFWWALGSAKKLADRLDQRAVADLWQKWQEKVTDSLTQYCWDSNARLWLGAPSRKNEYSRHANILAVVSGLSSKQNKSIANMLLGTEIPAVGTPYMKYFECMALDLLSERGVDHMCDYWGGMLNQGATTFFEAFDCCESDVAAFYDRPFGRSLCHAWSAGPAQFLPASTLGVRPLADGWKEWTCSLRLGGLEWASATVPTPHGCIEVQASGEVVHVVVPHGTTLKMNNGACYDGPVARNFRREDLRNQYAVENDTLLAQSASYRNWHYYPDHVIPPRLQIECGRDIQMTDVPTVYQLPGDNHWYMSFVGFDGAGYQSFVAESDDMVSWGNIRLAMGYGEEGDFDYGGRVLGAYLYEDYSIDAPRILKRKDGKFWSVYGAYEKRGGYEIDPGYEGLATSNDGITWHRATADPILSVHSPDVGDWEKNSIYQPWLVEHNGQYMNFYNAKQTPPWTEQIGVATSLDLVTWQRHPANPVLTVCPSSFDSQFVADAKVFRDGDTWVMFYFGVGPTWDEGAHIQAAYSSDLIHWNADREPLYRAGGHPSGLDKEHAHKISLVWNSLNETWYMFYCAVGCKGRGIGLITSKPVDQSI